MFDCLRALASLITNAHLSPSSAFCHHLLTFISHGSFSASFSQFSIGLPILPFSSLLSNIFLTTFPWSILTRCPIHSNLFFLISAAVSKSLYTYSLTHSLHGADSLLRRANQFSANQEIPHSLWNSKVHYQIHKCLPPVPILSHLDPVHTPRLISGRSILILSSHLSLCIPSGLFPSGFPTKTQYMLLSSMHATCLACLILLDFITRTILGEEYRSLCSYWNLD